MDPWDDYFPPPPPGFFGPYDFHQRTPPLSPGPHDPRPGPKSATPSPDPKARDHGHSRRASHAVSPQYGTGFVYATPLPEPKVQGHGHSRRASHAVPPQYSHATPSPQSPEPEPANYYSPRIGSQYATPSPEPKVQAHSHSRRASHEVPPQYAPTFRYDNIASAKHTFRSPRRSLDNMPTHTLNDVSDGDSGGNRDGHKEAPSKPIRPRTERSTISAEIRGIQQKEEALAYMKQTGSPSARESWKHIPPIQHGISRNKSVRATYKDEHEDEDDNDDVDEFYSSVADILMPNESQAYSRNHERPLFSRTNTKRKKKSEKDSNYDDELDDLVVSSSNFDEMYPNFGRESSPPSTGLRKDASPTKERSSISSPILPGPDPSRGESEPKPGKLTAPEMTTSEIFPVLKSGESYSDAEFHRISTFLKNSSNSSWCVTPRLYTVLRLIKEIDTMDIFTKQGITDIWFPFTHKSLPSSLSPAVRGRFLDNQHVVLSKSFRFEKSSGKRHAYFAPGEPLPFTVVAKLGTGAHAHVDKVTSVISHREFARKTFRRQRGVDKDAVKSFLVESRVLKRLQHYHCVELMYSYTDPKYFALLMAPVADCNLNEYYVLARECTDKRSLLRSFLGCLANALHYIHSIRIRHRDITPHNIPIKGDRILLTDFGIALDWENLSRSTTTADSGKTWVYAAPEVARYEKRNTSADVWSLGCVFMEIVTVLKGETIAALRSFFEQQTGNYRFYANTKVLPQWAKNLRTRSSDKDDISFKWVRGMLEEDADDRPTAAMLYADIVEQCKVQSMPFCGSCCVEGAESSGAEDHDEEDPWEQDEDTTVVLQGG